MNHKFDGYFPQVRLLDLTTATEVNTSFLIHNGKGELNCPIDTVPHDLPHYSGNTLIASSPLIDLCSYSGEPGFETSETLQSLSNTAQAGGFSRVCLLPNTNPPIDRLAVVEFFRSHSPDPFLLWGSITQGCKGEQLTEFRELANHVVGFSDGKPIGNLLLLRRAMEYIKPLGKPLLLMAQNPHLSMGVMREGFYSLKFGLAGIPIAAETIALAGILDLVRLTGCPVHIAGISCGASLPLITRAKDEGLPITTSVPWTHLVWNCSHLHSYNPHLRLNPPLGESEDQTLLIAGIKQNTIDAIAIHHRAYPYEEKMIPFEVTPPGTIGLQFALPLLWANLVESNQLTPSELWRCLSINPAKILQIDLPSALNLFDPDRIWKLDSQTSSSRSRNTILWQKEIKGSSTLVRLK